MPSPSVLLKGLGYNDASYEKLSYEGKIDLKSNHVVNVGLKKFLDNRNLLGDEVRNEDVVIYLTNAIPSEYGIYYILYI